MNLQVRGVLFLRPSLRPCRDLNPGCEKDGVASSAAFRELPKPYAPNSELHEP